MKAQVSYFHRVTAGTDLAALERQHQQVFPGNKLAVLEADLGLLAKVAYETGSTRPMGTLSRADALGEIEPFAQRKAKETGIG